MNRPQPGPETAGEPSFGPGLPLASRKRATVFLGPSRRDHRPGLERDAGLRMSPLRRVPPLTENRKPEAAVRRCARNPGPGPRYSSSWDELSLWSDEPSEPWPSWLSIGFLMTLFCTTGGGAPGLWNRRLGMELVVGAASWPLGVS